MGGFLLSATAAASFVNIAERVIMSRDARPARTCLNIDQRIARRASGSRVFLPRRATSRYPSQVPNCHASTTCSHSVSKNLPLNLWFSPRSLAAHSNSWTISGGARLICPKWDL